MFPERGLPVINFAAREERKGKRAIKVAPRAIPSELPAINFSVSAARGSLLFSVGSVNANGSNHSVAGAIRIFRSSPVSRVPLKILCADQ